MCAVTPSTASQWGGYLTVDAVGATPPTPLSFPNLGGCVLAAAATETGAAAATTLACGTALEEQQECELASCVPYCPVASASDTAGMDAILGTASTNGCLTEADTLYCASYVAAANTYCANQLIDSGAGPFGVCLGLYNSTAAGALNEIFAAVCGGMDAGL
jgi:hypothetical protein